MSKTYSFFIALFLSLLIGCSENPKQVGRLGGADQESTGTPLPSRPSESTAPLPDLAPTPTAAPDCVTEPETEYWNGGDFQGQAVVSAQCGISAKAHEVFGECGLGDEHILEIISQDKPGPRDLPYDATIVLSRMGAPDATPTWSTSYSARILAPGVFLVTCERVD